MEHKDEKTRLKREYLSGMRPILKTELSAKINASFSLAVPVYWGADKSLARPTSRCSLFDG
jgi:hypothetical protein